MKHIAVDLHFVCDYVAKVLLNSCHVSSHDRLTEAHTRSLLEMLRSKIGMITDGETILQGHVKESPANNRTPTTTSKTARSQDSYN